VQPLPFHTFLLVVSAVAGEGALAKNTSIVIVIAIIVIVIVNAVVSPLFSAHVDVTVDTILDIAV
jgi:hypothetical protein